MGEEFHKEKDTGAALVACFRERHQLPAFLSEGNSLICSTISFPPTPTLLLDSCSNWDPQCLSLQKQLPRQPALIVMIYDCQPRGICSQHALSTIHQHCSLELMNIRSCVSARLTRRSKHTRPIGSLREAREFVNASLSLGGCQLFLIALCQDINLHPLVDHTELYATAAKAPLPGQWFLVGPRRILYCVGVPKPLQSSFACVSHGYLQPLACNQSRQEINGALRSPKEKYMAF